MGIQDHAVRAITDDGAFRVVVATTTSLTAEGVRRQAAQGQPARCLGDLLTSAVLVRETMAPSQRLQAILVGRDRRCRAVADSHPQGETRGLLTLPAGQDEIPLAGGTLEVMRTLYSGDLHRGLVSVPEGGVSQAVMSYLSASEQVASMFAVTTLFDEQGEVELAGGYLVQLLPEVGRQPLQIMTERLRDFEDVSPWLRQAGGQPSALLAELLYAMPYTIVGESPVRFQCQCSSLRVLTSLATVGQAELTDMIATGEVLDITCDYCGQAYRVGPEQLRGLLAES
ncbi:MAG: Hsp33 family molecular chaperone HslO [Myxococcales bacterium]|nr:Hsp33 family molecular chaperone HslO [Myxococcales bacterium]